MNLPATTTGRFPLTLERIEKTETRTGPDAGPVEDARVDYDTVVVVNGKEEIAPESRSPLDELLCEGADYVERYEPITLHSRKCEIQRNSLTRESDSRYNLAQASVTGSMAKS